MPGLVPGIHEFLTQAKTWMAGTSPAMTRSMVCSGNAPCPLEMDRALRRGWPFIVAGVMMAISALLEALQGLTPDRTPDLPTALSAAAGALTAGVLAKLVILARKLALARAKQI
jgi:hypothetical protein